MREILFKAKDKKGKKWLYGDILSLDFGTYIFHKNENGERELSEVSKETVCQFTGIRDIYGNNIFEKDILHLRPGYIDPYHQEAKAVVVLWTLEIGYGTLGLKFLDKNEDGEITQDSEITMVRRFDNLELRVIGNIFDKKEKKKIRLLKRKER